MHSCFALVHYFPVMHSDSCNNMIILLLKYSRIRNSHLKIERVLRAPNNYTEATQLRVSRVTALRPQLIAQLDFNCIQPKNITMEYIRGLLYLFALLMALVCVIVLYKNSVSHIMLRHPIKHQFVPVRFPTAVDEGFAPGNHALVQTSQGAMDAAENVTPAQVPRGSIPDAVPDYATPSLPSHHPYTYLIALQYYEQLASATRNVFQLANLTIHWSRRAVEPFIVGSTYSAVPFSPSLSGLFRFSDFYNISSVAAQMGDCFSKDLVLHSFEDFLVNATRNFLLLNFWVSGDQSGQVADCTSGRDQFREAESRLNRHLERVKSQAIASSWTRL